MKRIFKYKLPRDGESIIINAHIIKWLEVQEQNGWPHIWAIVDDEEFGNEWTIIAWGTGWAVPEELMAADYLGTAQDGAGYVWHYFGEVAAPSYATVKTDYNYNPYDYSLSTIESPVTPYSITISCGDTDSLICNSKTDSVTAYLDSLMGVLDTTRTTTTASAHT